MRQNVDIWRFDFTQLQTARCFEIKGGGWYVVAGDRLDVLLGNYGVRVNEPSSAQQGYISCETLAEWLVAVAARPFETSFFENQHRVHFDCWRFSVPVPGATTVEDPETMPLPLLMEYAPFAYNDRMAEAWFRRPVGTSRLVLRYP